MGFIFYQRSPRFAGEALKPEILAGLSLKIRKTGVFVNAGFSEITETVEKYYLDAVQLHGEETADLCLHLKEKGIQVIKAFSIHDSDSFAFCDGFMECTDYFLFDTMSVNRGGSGQKFDWKLLDRYDGRNPFFLSGGIGPTDADIITGINNSSFYGIDLNSRFEIKPGLKDIEKLKKFIDELRHKHKQL
jgi:phosphoribosylanthranilate isomerase